MRYFITLIILLIITLYGQDNQEKRTMAEKITKSESEWATCLNPDEYSILREKGTEMAFTGEYYKHKDDGKYVCAACDYELFSSNTKYDSGTGWPSFYAALDKDRILEKKDNTLGMARMEILCARCESHLGHLFSDGPRPSGLRYCVNSISLDFKKAE
jgi:peptide-methionine (R)-S-oxide reductase